MADVTAEIKPWQHGFALDDLKLAASIFKEQHGPHVYGAFGLTKERDIAEAMHDGAFLSHGIGGQPHAALIYRTLAHGSTHETYYNRAVQIQAGETIVHTFAARSTADGTALLAMLFDDLIAVQKNNGAIFASDPVVWVEIFEEDGIAKAALEAAGFAYVDSKVLAGSEIKGLYVRGRVVSGPSDPAETTTLSMLRENFLTTETRDQIAAELAAYGNWAQHYSNYNKKDSWTAFSLRGYDKADPLFIIKPDEMSRKWKAENAQRLTAVCEDTIAAALFPVAQRVVNAIQGKKDRVRFMRLAPGGGELSRHADITNRNAGVADGRLARLHIPIVTNPEVILTQWNHRGQKRAARFPERALCYLDQRQPHTVINHGSTERIHLVIDTESNDWIRNNVAAGAF